MGDMPEWHILRWRVLTSSLNWWRWTRVFVIAVVVLGPGLCLALHRVLPHALPRCAMGLLTLRLQVGRQAAGFPPRQSHLWGVRACTPASARGTVGCSDHAFTLGLPLGRHFLPWVIQSLQQLCRAIGFTKEKTKTEQWSNFPKFMQPVNASKGWNLGPSKSSLSS